MTRNRSFWSSVAALCACAALAACSSDTPADAPDNGGVDASPGADSGAADTNNAEDATSGADAPDGGPLTACPTDGLAPVAFNPDGPFGLLRRELAADFTFATAAGTTFTLSEAWTGCDSYLFLPESIPVSDLNTASIWTQGVADLLSRSPRNVHYFFVPRGQVQAGQFIANMEENIGVVLGTLSDDDRTHWIDRLHVATTSAANLGSWVGEVMDSGIGQQGFGIDRFQRVRGVGSFADVERLDPALQAAGSWPWEQNLGYAAYEAVYFNFEAQRAAELAAIDATEVAFWDGEILEEFEDTTVTLPSAAEMANFDTMEVVIEAYCPNDNALEPGNCGAWDYLAHLWLFEPDAPFEGSGEPPEPARIEIARFITTYHREGMYVVDATPLLAELADGGERRFRWEFAPPWNTQPTLTSVRLRFSNQGKGARPTQAVPLYGDRPFDSQYNEDRPLVNVDIPDTATRVELWAIITGHGGEAFNCAEFCNHQHEFIINNRSFYREHLEVGNQTDCRDRVAEGVVPNQLGTWWFGRGGWCPGQEVEPWVEDVTAFVTPGETATVDYFGLFNGQTPPDGAGNIRMSSFLVIYE